MGMVHAFAMATTRMGVDGMAIARRHVSAEQLADRDARLPFDVAIAALEDFVEETDEWIGLRAGASGITGGALDYLARNSPTLGVALDHMVRFSKLTGEGIEIEKVVTAEVVDIDFTLLMEDSPGIPTRIARQGSDALLSLIVALGREITDTRWVPNEVRLRYSSPPDTTMLSEFFEAPLRFDCERTGLSIEPALMSLAVVEADAGLHRILESMCSSLLERLPREADTATEVTRRLMRGIPKGAATLEAIAGALAITPRTLQRRLSEEGTTFLELVDAARYQLARRYLAERQLSVHDTALLLGYSETRAFHRAFKRWAGQTPADFRAAAESSSPN